MSPLFLTHIRTHTNAHNLLHTQDTTYVEFFNSTSHTRAHTHTQTHTIYFMHIRFFNSNSLSNTQTLKRTHSHTFSPLSLSLSLKHTHTRTFSLSRCVVESRASHQVFSELTMKHKDYANGMEIDFSKLFFSSFLRSGFI